MNFKTSYSRLRLQQLKNGTVRVSFYIRDKRFRYTNATILGQYIHPNKCNAQERDREALELLTAFKLALDAGWSPDGQVTQISLPEALNRVNIDPNYTRKYQKDLKGTLDRFQRFVKANSLEDFDGLGIHCKEYLEAFGGTPSTFNHERKRLSTLLSSICDSEGVVNPVKAIKKKREKQTLNKPYHDVTAVLDDVKSFNRSLYICCLLTYGCLLRPHQEIRNLKWGDFSEGLTQISLPGNRNKSGRNRIVPVSEFIRRELAPRDPKLNIFSGNEDPFNEGYFKLLWRRYKSQSNVIQADQTLYSFRHTGAIAVYKQTGSLEKLQQCMGHSSLAVTLGYLRGVDIPQLTQEDMPRIKRCNNMKPRAIAKGLRLSVVVSSYFLLTPYLSIVRAPK